MSTTEAPPMTCRQGTDIHAAKHDSAAAHDAHDDLPKDLKKPHFLTIIVVSILFVALLGGLFVVGELPRRRAEAQAKADAALMSEDTITVATMHPRAAAGAKEIPLPCEVRANQETLIVARTSGYLKHLYVDIQDHVQKDQLLAEIDAPEVDAQLLQAQAALKQANADVAKAQTDVELAQRTYDRFKNATSTGGEVSQQELDERATARDQAKAILQQMQASVGAAEANVQRLKVLQGFDKVTAPFAGTITTRNYDVGALLAPSGGREIFRLQQSDPVRVFANVPQMYSTQIQTGQTVTMTVRNFPKRTFSGKVTRNANAINTATRTMPFEVQFPNPDGTLVPGMFGQAIFSVASAPESLLVPVSAMLFNATGTQVAIVRDGKVHFQQVVVGRDLGTDLEVFEGLNETTDVITNPGERLTEGAAVKVANATTSPSS